MRSGLPKLTLTLGVMTLLISLSTLEFSQSRSWADEEYPPWPDVDVKSDYYCPVNSGQCPSCDGGTYVYGAIPVAPASNYFQGDCMHTTGGGGSCWGTSYKCLKRFCASGQVVGMGEYYYDGNWCKTGS